MRLRDRLGARVLLATVVLIALTVLTTAWMVSRSVEGALRAEAARSLADDTDVYGALLDYGTTHDSWDGVAQTVRDLAEQYDRRVALTTVGGRVIVDSARLLGQDAGPLRTQPDAVVDPAEPQLGSSAPGSVASAIGPPQQPAPAADVAQNEQRIRTATACLDALDVPYTVQDVGDGTQEVALGEVPGDQDAQASACLDELLEPTVSQRAAIDADNAAVTACLDRAGVASTLVDDGYAPSVDVDPADGAAQSALETCREDTARSSVAPRALLFLGSSDAGAASLGRLATGSTLAVVAVVIGLGSLLALLVTAAITRPLAGLAAAAHRVSRGDLGARVGARGRGEVRQVADAFDTMAGTLARTETQRRQLVSDIAHELRNPLVTLNGTLEAIQDEVYAATPEVIDSLAEEARQLNHLVADLQDLAAAEAGALRLAHEPVDLEGVARAVVDAHAAVARATGLAVRVECDAAAGAAVVQGDEVRLRQVLTNLLSNALRYSPAGGEVVVGVAATDAGVRVRVVDEGIGIPAEQLPFVFDRFWRADPARARATGGTGLGLAISRELVQAHGGELTVTSEPGRGSEFVVVLPAAGS